MCGKWKEEKRCMIDYNNDSDGRRLESGELRENAGAGECARSDGVIWGRLPDLERSMKPPRAVGLQPAAAAGDIMDGWIDGDGVKRKRASAGGWRRRAGTKRLHTSADTADQAKIDSLLFCRAPKHTQHRVVE